MRSSLFLSLLIGFILPCYSPALLAQDSTRAASMEGTLPSISVEAARVGSVTDQNAPFSVSILSRGTTRRNLEPGLSLDNVLNELPGLWVNDRGNSAIGERISIRGMGWRSAFGVRGVQVVLDGIPLTMPDGQAFADIVSPAMIQYAEVLRGPSSLFWGNGSGGVLYLSTKSSGESSGIRLRALGGGESSFESPSAFHQIAGEGRFSAGTSTLNVFVSNDRRGNFREYSSSRFTRASVFGTVPLKSGSILQFTGALADQDAENPGQLTREQFTENPRMANARNVSTFAGKQSLQVQLGTTLYHQISPGQLSATIYGIVRDLDNPLSFTYIDLNRVAGGFRVALENQNDRLAWGVGFDASIQDDDRRNLNNDNGNPGEEIALAQDETVRNTSIFGFIRTPLIGPVDISAGLRGDLIKFSMSDRLLDNGDQTGDRTFSAISPAIGLTLPLNQALVYTNFRSAFETPTTTELVNRPDLTGGFNPDVDPQRVNGIELGIRGQAPQWNSRYDIAVYTMQVQDRLIPFQTEEGGDRTFYRNGGENSHRGLEIFFASRPAPWLEAQITHTSNVFEYSDDEFDGNRLPGIPDHRTQLLARFNLNPVWLQLSMRNVSSFYVNDANTEKNDAYSVYGINIGANGIKLSQSTLYPFFTIANVFDEVYSSSVVINAFGGRYYEPAPGRSFQLGLNLHL